MRAPEPQRPAGRIRPDRAEPLQRRLATVRVALPVDEPERRRLPFVPPWQPERRRPGVRVEFGEAPGSPLAGMPRQQLDPPVVAFPQRRQERRQLHHEPFVTARVAHRVHRPQDGPEPATLLDREGTPVRRPLAEAVPGALALRDLPVEVADDRDIALDVGCRHGVGDGAQRGSGGGPNFKAELTLAVFRPPFEKQHDPFRCDRVAVAYRRVRSTQHQPPADQPGIDPNAARKAVAAMVVDQIADTDPEPRASVAFPGLHPPATNRHPEPSPLARQSMRDQVDVPVATRGLHLSRTVHDPPVLHRIGPEGLAKPRPGRASGASGQLGCPRRDHPLPAAPPRLARSASGARRPSPTVLAGDAGSGLSSTSPQYRTSRRRETAAEADASPWVAEGLRPIRPAASYSLRRWARTGHGGESKAVWQ